jgi:DNA-binding LytR/AlgR family response regulator
LNGLVIRKWYFRPMAARYRCMIVDDEPEAHYVLTNYLNRLPEFELVAQVYNAASAIDELQHNKTDLLFLDIDMPGTSGLELLRNMVNPPLVILCTAYQEFALQGFDLGVVDYLLKPVPFQRFEKAVNRFKLLQSKTSAAVQDDSTTTDQFLRIRVDGEMLDLDISTIIYVQSWGNYLKIYTAERSLLTQMTTAEIEQKLPDDKFLRVHKSFIVAIGQVVEINGKLILLKHQDVILPIGITYRQKIMEKLNA